MRNYKEEENLLGKENWPEIESVLVEGISDQNKITPGLSDEEKRAIINSWNKVAVIKVTAKEKTPFFAGFSTKNKIQFLKHAFETDLKYGMRVGVDDIRFFAIPIDLNKKLEVELIEITDTNDKNYSDLILI